MLAANGNTESVSYLCRVSPLLCNTVLRLMPVLSAGRHWRGCIAGIQLDCFIDVCKL